jgi:hypothetical protein
MMEECFACHKKSDVTYRWIRISNDKVFCSWDCLGVWCDSLKEDKEGEKK